MTTYVAETPTAFIGAAPSPIISDEIRFRLARAGKRLIDVAGATTGLLLLAPVLLVARWCRRAGSPAPWCRRSAWSAAPARRCPVAGCCRPAR